ncbi:hypothetical protein BH10ACI1_BH10ACI1_22350 [soil metagenome]
MREEIQEKLEILQSLYKTDLLNPFPYEDCRKLLADKAVEFEDFIPSLDLYFSDIAGFCSWGKRSLSWSSKKIEEIKPKLQSSFFQQFPKFNALKPRINEETTPKLYSQILIHDLMRLTLLDILSERKSEINTLALVE